MDGLAADASTDVHRAESATRIRLSPLPGVLSFITIESDGASVFAPRHRLTWTTLVASTTDVDDGVVDFLDDANATVCAGAWERFGNGDIGLTASVLIDERSQSDFVPLVTRMLALQVEEARALGAPEGSSALADATGDAAAIPLKASEGETPSFAHVAEHIRWRSSHDESQRWPFEERSDDHIDFLVPRFVAHPIRNNEGALVAGLTRLSFARTEHPRRGGGFLFESDLPDSVQDDAIRWRLAAVATQGGRSFGASVGAVMLSLAGEDARAVYRGFVPDDLLVGLDKEQQCQLLADCVLGGVNAAGVATAVFAALAREDDIDEELRAARMQHRHGVLRAATHTRPQAEGLADMQAPVPEVGAAMLDRLAVDQLQISTAPYALSNDGFTWLPTAHSQEVHATPMRPSRGQEISYIRVATRLGSVPAESVESVRRRCVDLQDQLPLAGLVADDGGNVDLVSTLMIHEGVWWHRANMTAVVAALHTTIAGPVASGLSQFGLLPAHHDVLREADSPAEPDPIAQVVPDLLPRIRDERDQVLLRVRQRLLERPRARATGQPDGPDAILPLRSSDHDGGWDPPLGEIAIFIERFDDPVAGPALRVTAHPGFELGPGHDPHDTAAALTQAGHDRALTAITPSWVPLGNTVGTTLNIPEVAIAHGGVAEKAAFVEQAIDSCITAAAEAIIRDPALFPDFDRSQVNETRTPEAVPRIELPPSDQIAVWAPTASARIVAVPATSKTDHWATVWVGSDAARVLIDWLETEPTDVFRHDTTDLVVRRDAESDVLTLQFPSGESAHLPASARMHLVTLLRSPELAACHVGAAVLVTESIDAGAFEDGIYISLKPAPAIQAVLSSPATMTIGATTSEGIWLRVASDTGEVNVPFAWSLVDILLDGAGAEAEIPIMVATPAADPRVRQDEPAPAQRLKLSVADLRDARVVGVGLGTR